ncbi:MAG: RNA polymerase sigma factor, partial [Bacteroidales bacterium]|nr:RNA polymerase sigma factor [Bacteroidales bacterium]
NLRLMGTVKFHDEIINLEPSLTRYAYSLTENMDDAKDLVQETYFKALYNQEKFDDQTNIKAWLYTIMKNTFINDYRRRVKKQAIFNKDVQEFVLVSKPSQSSPESDYNFRELTAMVNSLEPEFRIPFQMHDSGYKYQEIADELGLHLGTVKSRIHFSRQKLIEKLKK